MANFKTINGKKVNIEKVGFRNFKGKFFATNKPLTIEDLQSRKHNPHGENRFLDKSNVERLKEINSDKFTDLSVIRLTPEQIAEGRHSPYTILVHEGTGSHTAFDNEGQYQKWLNTLGLKETKVKDGFNFNKIEGEYEVTNLQGNAEELVRFGRKKGFKPVRVLSNGEVTEGYLEKGKQGTKIHVLNPNYPRKVFPYSRDTL